MPANIRKINTDLQGVPTGEVVNPQYSKNIDRNLIPRGYENIPGLFALRSLTIPDSAHIAIFKAETEGIRWRDDGIPPTPTIGMPLLAGQSYLYTGDLSKVQLIEIQPSAVLNVAYYMEPTIKVPLFEIRHETRDLSEYDTTVTDSGDLSVTLQAGMRNSLTVIGSELVTNGDFADWTGDDPDDWTVTGEVTTDPEISEVGTGEGHGGSGTGLCNIFTSDSTSVDITQAITTEIGKTYQLIFDIDTVTAGDLQARHTGSDYIEEFGTTGPKKIIFIATGTSTVIQFKRLSGATDITIDNVSCKEVTGATYGLQCLIDDTASIYGQMSINPNGLLRVRFYIDPSQLTMADGNWFVTMRVKSAVSALFDVRLQFNSGSYQLLIVATDDAAIQHTGIAQNIAAEAHFVEVLMLAAKTNISSDGGMTLWIDGTLVDTVSDVDNFDAVALMNELRIGAAIGIDAGTRGELFLDELTVRDDDTQIGA